MSAFGVEISLVVGAMLVGRGITSMRPARWKTVAGGCSLAALLSVPALSGTDNRHTTVPGTLNYLEGQVSIADQTLDSRAIGTAELGDGQVLETKNGKAEILLTPGVYLRLGNNSSVKMVSNLLTNTQVMVSNGEAMVEVDELYRENNLRISQPGAGTRIVKTGLYDFDAGNHAVRVFDGKALVTANDHETTVKKNRELALNSASVKATEFDKKAAQKGDLYRWSSLQSQYLSEANVNMAQMFFVDGGYGPDWWGPGWYWNPWLAGFTFLPANGFLFSPFGWGFYSPLMVRSAPVAHRYEEAHLMAIEQGFQNDTVMTVHGDYRMGDFDGGDRRVGGFSRGGFHGGAGRGAHR